MAMRRLVLVLAGALACWALPALAQPNSPGVEIPVLAKESHGSGIVHAALHNAHHLGQVITLRQLMALWPPPGGTITW